MRQNTDQKNSEYGHFSRSIKTKTIDPNKAHGHNTISIRMLRICNESICKPLGIIFSLISQNQSGLKLGDSCTNQLLSITYQVYKSFDGGHEVRSVFLDTSKAFDKV